LDELALRVEEYGSHPFLVTAGGDRTAHVVSVAAAFDGERFSLSAGRTSRANVADGGSVTLLWPGSGGPYGLIVDGTGEVDDAAETIPITPTRAVLHRLAGASEDLPSCVRIESPS
jgi:hypothetical protein